METRWNSGAVFDLRDRHNTSLNKNEKINTQQSTLAWGSLRFHKVDHRSTSFYAPEAIAQERETP